MSKYQYNERRFEYVYEYCPICNRIMQFEIDSGHCILCGTDHPYGINEYSQEQIDEYYLNNKVSTSVCKVVKKINIY